MLRSNESLNQRSSLIYLFLYNDTEIYDDITINGWKYSIHIKKTHGLLANYSTAIMLQ
mgnify:CR=1 FL=1